MIDTIEKEDNIISEEEAAQYDRQIRLWGLDAQKRFVDNSITYIKNKRIHVIIRYFFRLFKNNSLAEIINMISNALFVNLSHSCFLSETKIRATPRINFWASCA